jgi:threonine/homoserine/homoserine lactone efflux protein
LIGMLGIHGYWLFVSAGVLLNLTPGQDTMFIIGRSLTGGVKSGVAAACGISIGAVFHTLAAALGLAAILATSAVAFTVVKLLGAGYLMYLGVKLLLAKAPTERPAPANSIASAGSRSTLLQGILTNVLNPKVALFFLAFLPQFIEPTSSTKTLAFLALGATFITTGLSWCLVIAVAAARLQAFFVRSPKLRTSIDRVVGGLFLALGAHLAWSR